MQLYHVCGYVRRGKEIKHLNLRLFKTFLLDTQTFDTISLIHISTQRTSLHPIEKTSPKTAISIFKRIKTPKRFPNDMTAQDKALPSTQAIQTSLPAFTPRGHHTLFFPAPLPSLALPTSTLSTLKYASTVINTAIHTVSPPSHPSRNTRL